VLTFHFRFKDEHQIVRQRDYMPLKSFRRLTRSPEVR
jgi:hypothetical protein